MSERRAFWNSLMNTEQVVCIDHSVIMPSLILNFCTYSITRSVRSTSSSRSSVSMTKFSPWMTRPPVVARATASTGVSRTVTVELLLI